MCILLKRYLAYEQKNGVEYSIYSYKAYSYDIDKYFMGMIKTIFSS